MEVGDFVRLERWGDGQPFRVKWMDSKGIVLENEFGNEYKYYFSNCPIKEWKVYYHEYSVPGVSKEVEVQNILAKVREKHLQKKQFQKKQRNPVVPPHEICRMIRIGEEDGFED